MELTAGNCLSTLDSLDYLVPSRWTQHTAKAAEAEHLESPLLTASLTSPNHYRRVDPFL